MPPHRNRINNEADPAFAATVEQAVASLLPNLMAQITDEIRQNENNANQRNGRRGPGNNGDAQSIDIHVWLDRFRKEKPQTFSSASTLYFPYSKKEKCEREYKSIRQLAGETSTDFIKRFLRLAGFLGAKAGTQEEQAKHFKWGLNDFVLDRILNTEFTDEAQVANAARNIEIFLDDRRDSDRYGNRGRHGNRDRYGTDRWRGDRQGSDKHGNGSDRQGNGSQKVWHDQDQQARGQHYSRSYGSSSQSGYSDYNSCPLCNLCGKFHPGKACHRATGACFECGEVGHLAKDYKHGLPPTKRLFKVTMLDLSPNSVILGECLEIWDNHGWATGCMGSPSYPYSMARGEPPLDSSSSAPQKTLTGLESVCTDV
ncbi:hypothetical protein Tco_0407481 [Tanacetum coccineum]